MAGDWIKMRDNLWDDPRVAMLCDITDQPEAMIIGALYWLWTTADQHTENGILIGLSTRSIDRKTGVKDFAQALIQINWLADHPEGVRIIKFEEHNGKSAKKRLETAKRVAEFRLKNELDNDVVVDDDAEDLGMKRTCNTESVTELENVVTSALARIREEKNKNIINFKKTNKKNSLDDFEKFWDAYPVKKSKGQAERTWQKLNPGHDLVDAMIRAIGEQTSERDILRKQGVFVPEWKHPGTWLSGRCWEDQALSAAARSPPVKKSHNEFSPSDYHDGDIPL